MSGYSKNSCTIRGCNRPRHAEGLCSGHHKRKTRYGSPTAKGPCKIKSCRNQAKARGWCSKHYGRWQRTGNPNKVTKPVVRGRVGCKVEGCKKPHSAKGYCDMHYDRWKRHGDPNVVALNRQHADTCCIEGCERPYHSKGMCDRHYNRWRRTGDTLIDQANLDAQPLLDFINARGGLMLCLDEASLSLQPRDTVKTAVERAEERGWIEPGSADNTIIRLFGIHPCAVYGDDWWVGEEEMELAA